MSFLQDRRRTTENGADITSPSGIGYDLTVRAVLHFPALGRRNTLHVNNKRC